MTRLVATLGTQPGSTYETLLNVCRGSYDYGSKPTPAISVSEVVLIHTRAKQVMDAYYLAKLLLACQQVLPEDKRLPPNCQVRRIVSTPVDVEDIDSRASFDAFAETVRRNVSKGDVVDISGGRVAMGVAAALAAKQANAMVVATVIPSERVREIESTKNAILRNFDVKGIVSMLEQGQMSCAELVSKFPDLVKQLAKLVTGVARTYVLYP